MRKITASIFSLTLSPRGSNHAGDSETFDHEAIIGSAREAEEFDSLPPEEAKAKLAALVKRMDRDQDNKISKGVRFAACVRAMNHGLILQCMSSSSGTFFSYQHQLLCTLDNLFCPC